MSDKINTLKNMADTVEEVSYMREFSIDEIEERKTQLAANCVKQQNLKDELDDIKAEYKAEMKPVAEEISRLTHDLRTKREAITEKCFVEFDQDAKVAKCYSPTTGELVYTRPLNPSEMQGNLFSIKEAVNS